MKNCALFRFLVGLDQSLNPILFGGSEDVTMSAQLAYRELILHRSRHWRKIVDWIFAKLGHEQHCFRSLFVELDEFPAERKTLKKLLAEHGVERG